MKKWIPFIGVVLFFFSCGGSGSTAPVDTGHVNPEEIKDEMDAAVSFIKSTLNGKYTDARTLVLEDSTNMQYCDVMERSYEKLDRNKKEEYKLASIQDLKKEKQNDSVVLVNYKNSYENQPYQLKLVRKENRWLVDLKHSFQSKADTLK